MGRGGNDDKKDDSLAARPSLEYLPGKPDGGRCFFTPTSRASGLSLNKHGTGGVGERQIEKSPLEGIKDDWRINLSSPYLAIPPDSFSLRAARGKRVDSWGRGLCCTHVSSQVATLGEGEEKTILEVRCKRCGFSWWPRTPKPPARCPKCQCRKWDQEKK